LKSPFDVVRDFEQAVAEYCGAPYCVAVNSCTLALFLACKWCKVEEVVIPKRTYVSVPMSIIHAGGTVKFRDEDWEGSYSLDPYPIFDSARRFRSGMYGQPEYYDGGIFECVSFHKSKILGLSQGGAILHNDPQADVWFRKARFDGRTEGVAPKDDTFDTLGYHCYLSPDVAAHGLWRLSYLPKHNDDLPNDDYPDLSQIPLFQKSSQKSAGIMVGCSTTHSSSSWLQETPGQTQSSSSVSNQRPLLPSAPESFGTGSQWVMPNS
jgi:dTDP-4-amino-4,6-dideoxygalactose transaminase